MSKSFRFLLIAALVAAVGAPAAAQRPDKPAKPANPKGSKDQPVVRVVFHDSDRGVFREYYRAHREGVKPLPPGIAKNLARGKPLPPGIARTRVPDVVLVQLPWRPRGYTFFLVGDRIVLLDANGLVADILDSIF
jgi:Ni/Co efflux regulator RcnB